MDGYLGEFDVDVARSRYAKHGPAEWALKFVSMYGQIDGDHHKAWVLDQVARILKGTPIILKAAKWAPTEQRPDGLTEYRFWTGEPSRDYLDWVEGMLGAEGEDGEREYFYDAGVAP